MRTVWFLDGKKTSAKAIKDLVGEKRYKNMLTEAKESFYEDPYIDNSWFIGTGMVSVEFV